MKKIKQEKLELKNPVVDSILNKSKKESTTLIFENSVITKARNVKNAFVDGLFDKNALIGGACGAAALLIVAGISDASLDQHFNPEKYEGKGKLAKMGKLCGESVKNMFTEKNILCSTIGFCAAALMSGAANAIVFGGDDYEK